MTTPAAPAITKPKLGPTDCSDCRPVMTDTRVEVPRTKHRKNRSHLFDALARTPTAEFNSASTSPGDVDEQPIWMHLLQTSIIFTSFLLSLSYVDWRARSWRASQRQPVAVPSSPDPDHDREIIGKKRTSDNHQSRNENDGAVHKMLRKVIGMEVNDALDMRPLVATVLVSFMFLFVTLGWILFGWIWRRFMS